MMRRFGFWLRNLSAVALCLFAVFLYFSPQMRVVRSMPDTYYLAPGESHELPLLSRENLSISGDSIEVRSSGDESIQDKIDLGVAIDGIENGESALTVSLYGMPIRQVSVNVEDERMVVPGGASIGVTLQTKGALVVGSSTVLTSEGKSYNPGKEAGISPGDIIESVNGKEVKDAQDLSEKVNAAGSSVKLGIKRGDETQEVEIIPRPDAKDGMLRMGLWVRDSTIGVGTMSFYDPENNAFAALGHAITDIDTQSRLEISSGEILNASIVDVNKGQKGQPGELKGNFSSQNAMGEIKKNTDYGIYGTLYEPFENPIYSDGLPVAAQSEVHPGPAKILSTVDDSGIQSFDCEIVRVQSQSKANQRGMVFEVTDAKLLKLTGGIVQGMSGSPIVQDDKIIGVVTHVFVNDPTRGYGMYIEWMLDETKKVE